MEYLTLAFSYTLPNYLLIKRENISELKYKCKIEDFDIELILIPDDSWSSGYVNISLRTFGVRTLKFIVKRHEFNEPPLIPVDEKGIRDLSVQSAYFNDRLLKYLNVSTIALCRLIHFFKYQLRNPLLHDLELYGEELENLQWLDERGTILREGVNIFVVPSKPGVSGEKLGSRELVLDDDKALAAALEIPIGPSLYEELLSDAQSAAFEGNLRRAVLELAIGCEVIIYQTFFGESSPASEAFDFLVVEKYVQVAPKDLIHKVAKRAFGESFQEKHKDDYANIDNLFQCRNKVAHRGQLKYVDSKGKSSDVDEKLFAEWWKSSDILISWLRGLSNKL